MHIDTAQAICDKFEARTGEKPRLIMDDETGENEWCLLYFELSSRIESDAGASVSFRKLRWVIEALEESFVR